ncbi:MAG: carboxymuconolactone decarboxylase family protein [Candidatus Acidiferrum sp.]|jgi:alkylhydroperoxidase family enzyme
MRIKPLELPLGPESAATLAKWMPPIPGIEPLALFRILLQHRGLSEALHPLAAFQLRRASSIDLRSRELIINRTCARCHCEYEWGVHVGLLADRVGLEPTMVAATVTAPASDPRWSERDRCLISLVDALCASSAISDGLWAELRTHWDEQQIMELTVLAGFYHLISFIANVAEAPLESWAPRFPSSPSEPR